MLIVTYSPSCHRVLETTHASFIETVPFKTIVIFTLLQLVYLLSCFGITWIPVAGLLFPMLIMLLVPVRQYLLPRFFKGQHLQELDAAEYDEAPALPFDMAVRVCKKIGFLFSQRIIIFVSIGWLKFYFFTFSRSIYWLKSQFPIVLVQSCFVSFRSVNWFYSAMTLLFV